MPTRCHVPEIRPVISRWARWCIARITRTHLLFERIQSFGWRYLLAILLVHVSPATNSPLNACSPSHCRVFLHVSRTCSSTMLLMFFKNRRGSMWFRIYHLSTYDFWTLFRSRAIEVHIWHPHARIVHAPNPSNSRDTYDHWFSLANW